MQLEQYTADAICHSMGLGGFDLHGTPPAVRVLFKPSFHPEVCVTLSRSADVTRADLCVVALTEMLWRQPVPCRLPELREQVTVPASDIAAAEFGFAAALADYDNTNRRVYLDGIGIECCHLSEIGLRRFAGHVERAAITTFANQLIWLAWVACRSPGIRNALADCARYLGKDYPRDSDPEQPPGRRVLILGTPQERADYFALLRSRGAPT